MGRRYKDNSLLFLVTKRDFFLLLSLILQFSHYTHDIQNENCPYLYSAFRPINRKDFLLFQFNIDLLLKKQSKSQISICTYSKDNVKYKDCFYLSFGICES